MYHMVGHKLSIQEDENYIAQTTVYNEHMIM